MKIPVAREYATLVIAGVSLRVHVLDDARRVIDAADLENLLAALAEGNRVTDEEVEDACKAMQACYPASTFRKRARAD